MTQHSTDDTSTPTTQRQSQADAAGIGFVEPGRMFMHLAGFEALGGTPPSATDHHERLTPGTRAERFDVIVIGAGQAGLSVGYHLAQQGARFLLLDAGERVGDVWRKRWDSLRLFTTRRYDGLPGLPFSGRRDIFPTKDEMGDYLEAYAAHFQLPIRTNARVERVSRRDGRYHLTAAGREYEADHVVVAMSSYQRPHVPEFARDLAPEIVQLHSSAYRNLAQLRPGLTLIAGAGNSGAEIAMEVAREHPTLLSGRATGHMPFRIDSFFGQMICVRFLLRFVFHRVLTVKTRLGRLARPKIIGQGGPLIRLKPWQLSAAGVERVPRVAGVRGGLPVLDDGRVVAPANIVWCTGYQNGLSFLDLPIFDAEGEPKHVSGVVTDEPGLYFVGLHFLHAMSSGMIHGVGRDAERIAGVIAQRRTHTSPSLQRRVSVA